MVERNILNTICESDAKELEAEREVCSKTVYKPITGSDLFQVMIFMPNATFFKAAPHLCLCEDCHVEYGSCFLFKKYELQSYTVNPPSLRSEVLPPIQPDDLSEEEIEEDENSVESFIIWDTVVAVAVPPNSVDTIWLIYVKEINCLSLEECEDDYGHRIPPGINFIKGHFYEWLNTAKDGTLYNLSSKSTFYKETVVFPYVELTPRKKGFLLTNGDYFDMLYHMEQTGFVHL